MSDERYSHVTIALREPIDGKKNLEIIAGNCLAEHPDGTVIELPREMTGEEAVEHVRNLPDLHTAARSLGYSVDRVDRQ